MTNEVEVKKREVDGVTVLDVYAEHLTYPQSTVLKNQTAHLMEDGHVYFVFNMANVSMVDSFGLATIVSIYKTCREKGGNIALYGANELVQRLIDVTHLERVLEVWPSEGQAIYSLKQF